MWRKKNVNNRVRMWLPSTSASVASLFGGATGRLALDQEQLAAVGLALGAVRQFARQASAIQRAFAACQVAGFAGGFAGARRIDGFIDDLARHACVLLEEGAQLLVHHRLHDARDV